jgi:hypothetical protein
MSTIDPRPGLLQYLGEGGVVAGQLEASAPGRTAWVGIYPLKLASPGTRELLARAGLAIFPGSEPRLYRIRTFEIADNLRETWFSESDLQNKWSCIVIGDEPLFEELTRRNIPIGCLDSARLVDYPL